MKEFPVQHGGTVRSIPWDFIAPHEAQAQRNHGQTIERLAERGGCFPCEIVAIVEGRPWSKMHDLDALVRLQSAIDTWKASGTGGMASVEKRLDLFLRAMKYKLQLRKKRPPDPEKWPLDAVDENGDRDWLKCSTEFLKKKLEEETRELFEPGADLKLEAADVALVAFMIADREGAFR